MAYIMMTNRFTKEQRKKIKETSKELTKVEKKEISENEVVRRSIDNYQPNEKKASR